MTNRILVIALLVGLVFIPRVASAQVGRYVVIARGGVWQTIPPTPGAPFGYIVVLFWSLDTATGEIQVCERYAPESCKKTEPIVSSGGPVGRFAFTEAKDGSDFNKDREPVPGIYDSLTGSWYALEIRLDKAGYKVVLLTRAKWGVWQSAAPK